MSDDVIREFLVSIGVDASGVTKFEDTLTNVGKGVKAFGELAAAATAAIAVAVVKVADDFDKLYFQSKNLGSTVGDIKGLGYAFSQLGGSAGDASAAMASIANFNLSYGKGAAGFLERLGVDPKDVGDSAKTLIDLEKVFQRMASTGPDGVAKAVAIGGALGLSQDAVRIMIRDTGEFEAQFRQVAKGIGGDLDETAEKSHALMMELRENKEKLNLFIDALELKVLQWAVPKVEAMTKAMGDFGGATAAANVALPILAGLVGAAGIAAGIAVAPYVALAAAIASVTLAFKDWQWLQGMSAEQKKGFDKRGAEIRKQASDAFNTSDDIPMYERVGRAMGVIGGAFAERWTEQPSAYGGKPGAGGAAGVGGAASGGHPAGGGNRSQQAIDYFKAQGAGDVQARGIAAMLFSESGLDHTNKNGTSGAFGLAQWLSKDRLAAFKAMFGHDVQQSTFAEQLRFVQHELTGKYRGVWEQMKRAVDPLTVADIGIHGYESPGAAGERGDHGRAARFLGMSPAGGRSAAFQQTTTIHVHGGDTRAVVDGVTRAQEGVNAQMVSNAGVFQW